MHEYKTRFWFSGRTMEKFVYTAGRHVITVIEMIQHSLEKVGRLDLICVD